MLLARYIAFTWNGTEVTEPILIFQDELLLDGRSDPTIDDADAPGALVCRSQVSDQPDWRDVRNDVITSSVEPIRQVQSTNNRFSQLSRGTPGGTTDNGYNGLVTCRLGTTSQATVNVVASFKYVALYIRGAGECTT